MESKITIKCGVEGLDQIDAIADLYTGAWASRHLVALAALRIGLDALKADPSRLAAAVPENRKSSRLKVRT